MSTKKFQLGLNVLIVIVALIWIIRQGFSNPTQTEPKITIVKDTIYQTKIDTFKVQTTKYEKVYVNKYNYETIKDTIYIDTLNTIAAKVYKDTLTNNDIDIYSYNLVDGRLLNSRLSYKLKVPKQITITKTIEHPKTYRSGLYLFSEVGGNTDAFSNASLGLQYNRKGDWFASYRYDVVQESHNVGFGFRIFK